MKTQLIIKLFWAFGPYPNDYLEFSHSSK